MADFATRNKAVLLINIAGQEKEAEYQRMGEGFDDATESANPKVYSRTYINQETESSDITGYAPKISFTGDRIPGDKAQDYLVGLYRKTGGAARTDIVQYNEWDKVEGQGEQYKAIKQEVTVQIDNPGSGKGGDAAKIGGVLLFRGDAVEGVVTKTNEENVEKWTFAASTETSAANE